MAKKVNRPWMMSFEATPEARGKLDEIVKLAQMSNPQITRREVILRMINELHRQLCNSKFLPLPTPPQVFEISIKAGRNGHGNTQVER